MASYSTIPKTDEAPLLQRDVKVNVKTVLAGAAAATTSFMKPMYVFNKSLGKKTFEECEKGCPDLSGNDFKKGQMTIPCITSFDMNHQLLAWMTKKYGPVDTFAWIGHETPKSGGDGKWGPPGGEDFQKDQYKGDFIYRNGCAFAGNTKKTECTGSDFDKAPGSAALNIEGPVTSYEMLHGNWIKSADCEFAEVP